MLTNKNIRLSRVSRQMSITKYRDIVLDNGVFKRESNSGISRESHDRKYVPIFKHVLKHAGPAKKEYRTFESNHRALSNRNRKKHPLVEKGIAFWINDKTLVTGYTLKTNSDIFIPVYQPLKEQLNFKLRDDIRKYAKFLVAHKRQMLYKKTLMCVPELNILPEEIIDTIALYTYDPFSYIKL